MRRRLRGAGVRRLLVSVRSRSWQEAFANSPAGEPVVMPWPAKLRHPTTGETFRLEPCRVPDARPAVSTLALRAQVSPPRCLRSSGRRADRWSGRVKSPPPVSPECEVRKPGKERRGGRLSGAHTDAELPPASAGRPPPPELFLGGGKLEGDEDSARKSRRENEKPCVAGRLRHPPTVILRLDRRTIRSGNSGDWFAQAAHLAPDPPDKPEDDGGEERPVATVPRPSTNTRPGGILAERQPGFAPCRLRPSPRAD